MHACILNPPQAKTKQKKVAYLSNPISIHQGFFLHPKYIKGTDLEETLQIGQLGCCCCCCSCWGSGGYRRRWRRNVAVACIIAGGIRLLWGRNERHALSNRNLFLFLSRLAYFLIRKEERSNCCGKITSSWSSQQ